MSSIEGAHALLSNLAKGKVGLNTQVTHSDHPQ